MHFQAIRFHKVVYVQQILSVTLKKLKGNVEGGGGEGGGEDKLKLYGS